MKIKSLFFLLPMFVASLCLVSCGEEDDDQLKTDNTGTAQMTDDYIATTSVKKVTITTAEAESSYDLIGIKMYEDYNHLYSLSMGKGRIQLIHYRRSSGAWYSSLTYSYDDDVDAHGISDRGKVSSIEEVTSKFKDNDYIEYNEYMKYKYSTVQPNHGYAAFFTTEENEVKYLRIFIEGYTLDYSGALESITIQYQLY